MRSKAQLFFVAGTNHQASGDGASGGEAADSSGVQSSSASGAKLGTGITFAAMRGVTSIKVWRDSKVPLSLLFRIDLF
jgi:hypothetical protein